MSIDGISGAVTSPLFSPGPRPGGAEEARGPRPQVAAALEQQPTAPAQPVGNGIPVQAPEGTDPALWSVLTAEERTFFARAGAMGPVTYGPGRAMALSGAPLGGRLDVRA